GAGGEPAGGRVVHRGRPRGSAAGHLRGDVGAHHVQIDEGRVDLAGGAGLPVAAGVAAVPAEAGEHGGGRGDRRAVLRGGHLLVDAVVVDLPPDHQRVAVPGGDGPAAPADAGVVAAAGGDDVED